MLTTKQPDAPKGWNGEASNQGIPLTDMTYDEQIQPPRPMTTPNQDPKNYRQKDSELARQIETMSAFASGKTIEGCDRHGDPNAWRVCICPTWNWGSNDYRIQREPRSVWAVYVSGVNRQYLCSEGLAKEYVEELPNHPCEIVEFKEIIK